MALDVAVIGAGMAGLAAARTLVASGHRAAVFDKGRGVGGRVSTRRTQWGTFDHGAQYATVRDPAFSAYIAELHGQGAVHVWDRVKASAMIGRPGMSALVKAGFDDQPGLAVTTGYEVARVEQAANGFVVHSKAGDQNGPFDKLIVTAPAPQAAHLLRPFGDPFAALERVRYAPSYTLLAAFDATLDLPDVPDLSDASDLASACRQSARGPGRAGEWDLWVVQASAAFSAAHLEQEREAMVPVLLDVFGATLGVDVPTPVYAASHRWRYALVDQALGAPFLTNEQATLGVAGDGLLGPRVELAFLSGLHCAQAMG